MYLAFRGNDYLVICIMDVLVAMIQNIQERITEEQEQSSKARLREYMVTHGGFKSTADFVETRLKELRGGKAQDQDSDRDT